MAHKKKMEKKNGLQREKNMIKEKEPQSQEQIHFQFKGV